MYGLAEKEGGLCKTLPLPSFKTTLKDYTAVYKEWLPEDDANKGRREDKVLAKINKALVSKEISATKPTTPARGKKATTADGITFAHIPTSLQTDPNLEFLANMTQQVAQYDEANSHQGRLQISTATEGLSGLSKRAKSMTQTTPATESRPT
jgi:hypothetical protein